MTKENSQRKESLFKPEVYLAMQERLKDNSRYRGSEEAFEMFYADRKLQEFFRDYALKEDIVEIEPLKFMQAGRDRKIHLAGTLGGYGSRLDYPQLYVGPRQKTDAALVVYAREEDLYHVTSPVPRSYRLGEIKKIEEVWRIVVPEQIAQDGVGYVSENSYPVSQAPLFQEFDKQKILNGLERAVQGLIDETK
jgi:hypothetical protein